jgi:nitrile hydratase accessory protein
MRAALIAGNWKMNGSRASNAGLLEGVRGGAAAVKAELAVCVPAPYLAQVQAVLTGSPVRWGAQDVSAHERGAFTWPEWAAALAAAITRAQAAGDPDTGDTYYRHWLDALETLAIDRGLADAERLHALEHAWEAAAERTPHGLPIELTPAERARAR